MKQVDLAISLREKNSKNGNRRARRGGRIPAVVYGGGLEPQAAYLDSVSFQKTLAAVHRSTIFNLTAGTGDAPQPAIIRDIQHHPVSELPLHVDFYRISLDKPIVVDIPVHGVGGVPAGVKMGGLLESVTRRVEIRCLPLVVPEHLDIDISGIAIGHSLHVSDLKVPDGVEILTSPQEVLFIVAAPKAEEVKAPTEGVEAAAAEPELVGAKEKKDKEEEKEKEKEKK
jgi:large subunit ribosomal protein L25